MKNLLCIDVFEGIDYDRLFHMAKDVGFDGLFSGEIHGDDFESMARVRRICNETGLLYETSHSRIPGCWDLWKEGEAGSRYVQLLKRNIDNCQKLEIPILVVHCQPEFQTEPDMALGLGYLEQVVRYAEQAGVKIAFENIDHPKCLLKTLEYFTDPHVGFCFDAGHEACRGYGYEFLPLVGDRLICTHIHDNDMVDDLHLIPFDGKIDWDRITRQLKQCKYTGPLTLEIRYGKAYENVPEMEFLKKCKAVAQRLQNMMQ